MSLLSTDIAKVNRVSLKGARLPASEKRGAIVTPVLLERPPSEEEIVYSKLVAIHPLLEGLVESLDLVSIETGDRIRKVKLREDIKSFSEPDIKAEDINKNKLIALAQRVIQGANNYTKEEIIARIKETTNVTQERAEKGFTLILEAGAIEQTIKPGVYYLTGSTPF